MDVARAGSNDNNFYGCTGILNPSDATFDLDLFTGINVRFIGSFGNPNFPEFSRATALGCGGSTFKSMLSVTGSSAAAGNVNLSNAGSKPVALTPYIVSRTAYHIVRLHGTDRDGSDTSEITRALTAEYKVFVHITGGSVSVGTVQTLHAPFAAYGTPDLAPTVTFSISGSGYNSKLNINVGSSEFTNWTAFVESYFGGN